MPSQSSFNSQIEEAADLLMSTSKNNGRMAVAKACAILCEMNADLLKNMKIAREVCLSMGDEPVLPLTEDICRAQNNIAAMMGALSVLMLRDVMQIGSNAQGEATDTGEIEAFIRGQEGGKKLN